MEVQPLGWEYPMEEGMATHSSTLAQKIPWTQFTYFPDGSDGKGLPAMQEMWVRSLGWEDPLEEGMATHSSVLA